MLIGYSASHDTFCYKWNAPQCFNPQFLMKKCIDCRIFKCTTNEAQWADLTMNLFKGTPVKGAPLIHFFIDQKSDTLMLWILEYMAMDSCCLITMHRSYISFNLACTIKKNHKLVISFIWINIVMIMSVPITMSLNTDNNNKIQTKCKGKGSSSFLYCHVNIINHLSHLWYSSKDRVVITSIENHTFSWQKVSLKAI